jgi:hypothetical protein
VQSKVPATDDPTLAAAKAARNASHQQLTRRAARPTAKAKVIDNGNRLATTNRMCKVRKKKKLPMAPNRIG